MLCCQLRAVHPNRLDGLRHGGWSQLGGWLVLAITCPLEPSPRATAQTPLPCLPSLLIQCNAGYTKTGDGKVSGAQARRARLWNAA